MFNWNKESMIFHSVLTLRQLGSKLSAKLGSSARYLEITERFKILWYDFMLE